MILNFSSRVEFNRGSTSDHLGLDLDLQTNRFTNKSENNHSSAQETAPSSKQIDLAKLGTAFRPQSGVTVHLIYSPHFKLATNTKIAIINPNSRAPKKTPHSGYIIDKTPQSRSAITNTPAENGKQ